MDINRSIEFINNHMLLSSGFFVVTVLLLHDLFDTLTRKYKTATPARVVELLNQEGTVTVDVREALEFNKGHIEGAIHIMYGRLKEKLYEIEAYRNSPVVVYCQQGTRSKEVCKQLVKEGFTQVYYLDGGVLTWQEAKLPLVRKNKK